MESYDSIFWYLFGASATGFPWGLVVAAVVFYFMGKNMGKGGDKNG